MAELNCPLREAALRRPDAPALCEGAQTVSYAELDREVTGLAARLQALGIRRSDRLVVASEDRPATVRWLLAGLRLGVCIIILNPRQPPPALEGQLERAGARWQVADSGLGLSGECILAPRLFAGGHKGDGQSGFAAVKIDADAPCSGVFTSGSSGEPKLALHSYRNHHASAQGSAALIPLRPGDRWGAVLPLFHVGGLALVFRCLLAGACLQFPAQDEPLARFVRRADGPCLLSAVATQIVRLQQAGVRLDAGPVHTLLLGGSAFPQGLLDWLSSQRLRVMISYGLTEMSSQVMTGPLNPEGVLAALLPGRELRVAPDGEILVRGETLFLGYAREGRIERPLDDEGWFHTRDLGELTARGLKVLGRLDNQFISGGENIQPEEIEAWIARYPGVENVIVVPAEDEEYGQRPVALIKGIPLSEAASLQKWLRERLPGYKIPQRILPLPELPPGQLKYARSALSAYVNCLKKQR